MIFYTYKERNGLLKPAAVVMQLHQMHVNICFAQCICKCKRIPCVRYSNKETLGFTSVGWKTFAVNNSLPFFPCLPIEALPLYTSIQDTAAKNIFLVQLALFGTDFLFALNENLGVGRIFCLSTHGCNPRVRSKKHSHVEVSWCLKNKAK